MPIITFGHIRTIIRLIKADFEDKLENEAWMNSRNPVAILLKNLDILYADHYGSDLSEICSREVTEKLLRIIFKWGEKPPKVIQFLKDNFNAVLIDELQNQYKKNLAQQAVKPIKNLVCIDVCLSEESSVFKYFVGTAKNVYVSTDTSKIEIFLAALDKPEYYKEEIFKDPHILYIALAACRAGKITPERYASLSQWIELRKHYGEENVEICFLFDDHGNFTQEAKNDLLEYIVDQDIHLRGLGSFENPLLSDENLEEFKIQLNKLPKADQIFIKIKSLDKGYIGDIKKVFVGTGKGALFGDAGYFTTEFTELVFLPLCAYQSLVNTAFPRHPAKLVARMGNVGLKSIENAQRKNWRIVNVYYPCPINTNLNSPNNRIFHLTFAKTTTMVGLHDMFHGMVLSQINKNALSALFLAVDAVREYTGIDWSTGIWKITDASFLGEEVSDSADSINAFSSILENSYLDDVSPGDFLPELAAIFLDIHFKPEKWKPYIGNDLFKSNKENQFNRYLAGIEKYSAYFNAQDNPKLNIFKLAIIFEGMKLNKSEFAIAKILMHCDKSRSHDKENKLDDITYIKQKKDSANCSFLYWQDKLFDHESYNLLESDALLNHNTKQSLSDYKGILFEETIQTSTSTSLYINETLDKSVFRQAS